MVSEDLVEVTPDIAARYDGLHLNCPERDLGQPGAAAIAG